MSCQLVNSHLFSPYKRHTLFLMCNTGNSNLKLIVTTLLSSEILLFLNIPKYLRLIYSSQKSSVILELKTTVNLERNLPMHFYHVPQDLGLVLT